MTVKFTIPGRPVGWQRTNSFKGRRITPKAMREKQAEVRQLYKAARGKLHTGPVKVTVVMVLEMPASFSPRCHAAQRQGRVWHMSGGVPDLDNMVKLVGDALNGVAYADDRQVAVITAGKRYGAPERTEVVIEPLQQADGIVLPAQRDIERKMATGAFI
jgi:Holliday junction resolvase RusA-like endonuclease